MKLVIAIEIDDDLEHFEQEVWPQVLDSLGKIPQWATVSAPEGTIPLSIALPTKEGMVKP
jgi:hypothetical protein